MGFPVALLTFLVAMQVDHLQTTATYINSPRIAASGGYAITVWSESASQQLFASLLAPGAGWSAPVPISDSGPSFQGVPSVAVGSDGTAIAAWRQEVLVTPAQSQVVTRIFTPGKGWSGLQILSTSGVAPVIAIASDGVAQVVYYESPSYYARTLSPGAGVWSPAVRLGDANFVGDAQLAVEPGLAYAAYTSAIPGPRQRLYLAMYDSRGWHGVVPVTTTDADDFGPQLAIAGAKGLVAWGETVNGLDSVHYLLRLPSRAAPFFAPANTCQYSMTRDGDIVADCLQTGDAVPGCFDMTRGGPVQAYYVSVASYRRALWQDWVFAGMISDTRKRASALRATADGMGNTLVTWSSEVPCQAGTNEALARVMEAGQTGFRPGPEQLTTGPVYSLQSAANGGGLLRYSWAVIDTSAGTPLSNLYASSLTMGGPVAGDLNSDGVVDCLDFSIVQNSLGKKAGDSGYDARADTNSDGIVDDSDLNFVIARMPQSPRCEVHGFALRVATYASQPSNSYDRVR